MKSHELRASGNKLNHLNLFIYGTEAAPPKIFMFKKLIFIKTNLLKKNIVKSL